MLILLNLSVCTWLSPGFILEGDMSNHKKPCVTRLTHFVSLPFDQHKHLDYQGDQQKNSGIGLQANDEQHDTNQI